MTFTLEEELELTKDVPKCAMYSKFGVVAASDSRSGQRFISHISLYDYLRLKALGQDVVVIV